METTAIEEISFKMISFVGMARSCYMDAVAAARNYNFEEAMKLIEEGNQYRVDAHKVHFDLIQKDVSGDKTEFSLILMHAEDQLMSSEVYQTMSEEIIKIYQELGEVKDGKKGN